jgi:hypothetical protein
MAAIVLSAVPILSFDVAQVATSGNASAIGGSTICTGVVPVVTFPSSGLSYLGAASVSSKSTITASSSSLSCRSGTKPPKAGTLNGSKIKAKSTLLCSSDTNPSPPGCTGNPGDYVYDSAAQFATMGGTLYREDKTISWKVGATTYTSTNTRSCSAGASECPGGTCPSEVGFVLTGHLTAPASQSGRSTVITVCLGTDTGTGGTSGNFAADLVAEAEGNTAMVIQTATLDGTTSSIEFG